MEKTVSFDVGFLKIRLIFKGDLKLLIATVLQASSYQFEV